MGDDFWLGFCAQDLRRALRAAKGPRTCGPHADYRDQGFRGKGEVLGCPGPRRGQGRGPQFRPGNLHVGCPHLLSVAQTPQLAPPSDRKAPVQRGEGTVLWLARPGPERHRLRRAPAPSACGPPLRGPFSGSGGDHPGAGRQSLELLGRVGRAVVYTRGRTETLGRGQKEFVDWRRG